MTQAIRSDSLVQTLYGTDDRLARLERDDNVPVGSILMFGGTIAPPGFLICDGSPYDRTDYANLFGIIGTRFGIGDGSLTFNVPNMQNRMPLGLSPGVYPGSAIGQSGGEQTHTLITSEMPSHYHPLHDTGHSHGPASVGSNFMLTDGSAVALTAGAGGYRYSTGFNSFTNVAFISGVTMDIIGDDVAHNNMPPYITLNFIIATGIREG
jgi:microcystin-dependent protein